MNRFGLADNKKSQVEMEIFGRLELDRIAL